MPGKTEGKWRRGWQRMSWLASTTDSMDVNLSKLQETVKDWGAWHVAASGVAKSWTQPGDWTTTKVYKSGIRCCIEAGHSMFDPCAGKIPWRRKWQSIPVFLPGKSHGQKNLVSYSPGGHKESDMSQATNTLIQSGACRRSLGRVKDVDSSGNGDISSVPLGPRSWRVNEWQESPLGSGGHERSLW